MDPITMEIAVKSTLATITSIVKITQSIHDTPTVVEHVTIQSDLLSSTLDILYRKSQLYILSNMDIQGWLKYQNACNTTLLKIEDILGDYARSIARNRVLGSVKFVFGPKSDLSKLLEVFDNRVKEFMSYAEM